MEPDGMLLEPNVVADMKRDLAEKGIIAFPPDLPQDYHLAAAAANLEADSEREDMFHGE